jgi:hypothetical protein
MDRDTFKHPETPFVGQRFRFAGTLERDEWLKTFPNPLPKGHALQYRWVNDFTVELVVVATEPVTADTAKLLEELEPLSHAELKTRAAELGVKAFPKATKQQLATQVAEKMAAMATTGSV